MIKFSTEGLFDRLFSRIFGENAKYVNMNICVQEMSEAMISILTTIENIINNPTFPNNIINDDDMYYNGKLYLEGLFIKSCDAHQSEYETVFNILAKIIILYEPLKTTIYRFHNFSIKDELLLPLAESLIECFDDKSKFYITEQYKISS